MIRPNETEVQVMYLYIIWCGWQWVVSNENDVIHRNVTSWKTYKSVKRFAAYSYSTWSFHCEFTSSIQLSFNPGSYYFSLFYLKFSKIPSIKETKIFGWESSHQVIINLIEFSWIYFQSWQTTIHESITHVMDDHVMRCMITISTTSVA